MSSQEEQVPAGTLQGFSPSQVQDAACVLSGSPQVAALPSTASAVLCSVVSSTQVMAVHLLHGVLHCLPQVLRKDAEQVVWDFGSLAALVGCLWGFYKLGFRLYLFGLYINWDQPVQREWHRYVQALGFSYGAGQSFQH